MGINPFYVAIFTFTKEILNGNVNFLRIGLRKSIGRELPWKRK